MSTEHGLPPGVRYDGPMNLGKRSLMMFTDTGETGSSFGLKPEDATPAAIAAEMETMRAKFRAAAPQPQR